MADLRVNLFGKQLAGPVIAASGTFGFGPEYAGIEDLRVLGGISGKGLTLNGQPGNDGERLLPYKLSSGEKQMLVILLTVLVRDDDHCVLFMDEPEASLHIEWQQKLIGMIRNLNPNVQLILTTHSPAVIMEGWLDAVTEVSEISSLIPNP